MRVLTNRNRMGVGGVAEPPAALFTAPPRTFPSLEREPAPGRLTAGEQAAATTDEPTTKEMRPSTRSRWMVPVAVAAVLISGTLGLATVAALGARDSSGADPSVALPAFPAQPPRPALDALSGTGSDQEPGAGEGIGHVEITATTVDDGTSVSLPGPGSRDWVAPGADRDGALVRADQAEELIEFRAANTQPGLPGVFRMSWHGAKQGADSGDATDMLGVRPSGRVEFVIRPLTSPADLVLHVSGNDIAVTVSSEDDSARKIVSAPAAIVTVPVSAGRATTVTVAPAGADDIGVATAELR